MRESKCGCGCGVELGAGACMGEWAWVAPKRQAERGPPAVSGFSSPRLPRCFRRRTQAMTSASGCSSAAWRSCTATSPHHRLGPCLTQFSALCCPTPRLRRVACSTCHPCSPNADWCLQSDGMLDVHLLTSTSARFASSSPTRKFDANLCVQRGALTVTAPGTYGLKFDNTDSWFTAKTIRYTAELVRPG